MTIWKYRPCAVPAILNETLPAASRDIENELERTQRLAWQYTALLENLSDCAVPPDLLRQALYNVRQHEAFLKLILVSPRASDQHLLRKKSLFTLSTALWADYMTELNLACIKKYSSQNKKPIQCNTILYHNIISIHTYIHTYVIPIVMTQNSFI